MDVSILIINYNTYDFITNAINSILYYTKDVEYQIIVIDNNSPDNSGQKLIDTYNGYSNIKIILSKENLGTSKAINLSLNYLNNSKYFLWLNPDILFKSNFVKTLFEFMETHNDCGIAGGNILDFDGNPTFSYSKYITSYKTKRRDFSILYKLYSYLMKEKKSLNYNYTNEPMQVGFVSGANMMVRSCIFSQIGGFEEEIFMYSEEVEFTYRVVNRTKYKVYSVPKAIIYHLEGGSFLKSKGFNSNRFKIVMDGHFIHMTKSYGSKEAIKSLKLHARYYLKLTFLASLINNKNKKDEFKSKRKIVLELLETRRN